MNAIQQLAPEILSEIFDLVVLPLSSTSVPDITPREATHQLTPIALALILSHVSQTWRSIATSLPDIWSTIHVTDPERPHIALFELFLRRSKGRPLRLAFRCTRSHSLHLSIFAETLHVAARHSERWVSFTLKVGKHVGGVSRALLDVRTPRLEALGLDTMDRLHTVWSSIIKNSPCLTEVQMSRKTNLEPSFVSVIPYGRLTTLCLSQVDPLFFNHLSQCKELETLVISCDTKRPLGALSAKVALPSLHRLLLVGNHSICRVLDALDVPSLSTLTICVLLGEYYDIDQVELSSSLEGMLNRSKAKLRSFSFIDRYFDSLPRLSSLFYLPSMRSVSDLYLNYSNPRALVENLTASPWDSADISDLDFIIKSTALPNLRRIHLDQWSDPGLGKSLVDMALSRSIATPAVAKLESLSVNFIGPGGFEKESQLWDAHILELAGVEHRFILAGGPRKPMFRGVSVVPNWI